MLFLVFFSDIAKPGVHMPWWSTWRPLINPGNKDSVIKSTHLQLGQDLGGTEEAKSKFVIHKQDMFKENTCSHWGKKKLFLFVKIFYFYTSSWYV